MRQKTEHEILIKVLEMYGIIVRELEYQRKKAKRVRDGKNQK